MTRDELNRKRMMFQIYANRNRMPQIQKNNNEEPIAHSATNDFLEYRKKVAAGTRMQRENNKSNLFNVTAANEQYHQDLMDQNIIIHAGTGDFKPTYYQKVENAFGPGKHRYFYSKEEWDAYQNELAGYRKKADDYVKNRDANNNAGADRGVKDSTVANAQKYKKESEQNIQRRESLQNAQSSREAAMRSGQQSTQKMTEQRQQTLNNAQSGREAAIKNSESMVTPKKGAKDAVKELGDKAKAKVKDAVNKKAAEAEVESIRSDTARWSKYDKSVIDQVQSKYSDLDTFDKFLERAEKEGGVDKFYDNLEKEIKTLQNNIDSSNKPGADRAAKESSDTKKSSENKSNGDTAEERQKKILDDAFKEGANADDLASKYGVSTDYIRELVYNVSGKTVPTKKEIESKNSNNSGSNKTGTVSKEFQQEMESNSKKNTYELKSGPKNSSSNSSGYYFTVENGKTVKKAKHSSLEDGITTSDDISPDQEYLNFRARVEAGMKHFGQTRGLMSIPVNQALKNGESLSHAGITNKYYAKLDDFYGKGKPRYFYSKDEWDGYQRNKQGATQAGADRGIKQKEEASKIETKSYSDKKFENDLKNKGLAEAADNSYQKAYRNNLLNRAQSGREAAINNSSPFTNSSSSSSSSNNPVKKFANKLIDAINNKGTSDKVVTTVIVEDNTPENVQKAQSGREAAEKSATKRTMTTMAYNKAIKDYQEVAKEIDKEYGFDKLDPRDAKVINKTWQKLIKDTAKVIDSGKVDNPYNIKYEYQLNDDDVNSYAWAAYTQEYASEALRLNSIYNDLQNEYAKTLQTAQAMHDFDAIAESNKHASELFDQMQKVQEQIKENAKENDAKVLPYLAAVYKELL